MTALTPQTLSDRLAGLVPPAAPAPSTEQRILDAALASFTEHGIGSTTMSQLARDTGISREWLYKHFRNRDAVVLGVAAREALRFIDGLAARRFDPADFPGAVTGAFVYAVEFLRDHPLLRRMVADEPEVIDAELLHRGTGLIAMAVQACAGYLQALGDLDVDRATLVAETRVRPAATATFVPRGSIDLHDGDELRRYAEAVVPALLQAGTATSTGSAPG